MTPYYIGKGKNKRDASKYRNRFWKNIVKKHGFIVKRVRENLTEQEAWDLETELIKKYAKISKGSGKPLAEKVGSISRAQLKEIAQIKMPDLNANDLETAMKIVAGTARQMGVEIK